MILIGVDVGGTFTDLVVTNTESSDSKIHKIPTTPEDPSLGVIDGLLRYAVSLILTLLTFATFSTAQPLRPTQCLNTRVLKPV
ncbi:MAG: hypothetical protein CM1200mP41_37500 [Gammaproteobacteria bacterium]|nr:MAG: hypothetical protein CM1200mP41_37500 [Gammaproteobacteria bacterium]